MVTIAVENFIMVALDMGGDREPCGRVQQVAKLNFRRIGSALENTFVEQAI